jgi:pimeloyl-ACP methyl ester carboxylesterase
VTVSADRILLELDKHSADEVLDRITLVTAGSKDVATPPRIMRALHDRIASSIYEEIERGTHYTPIEYPQVLNEALERFFETQVFAGTW